VGKGDIQQTSAGKNGRMLCVLRGAEMPHHVAPTIDVAAKGMAEDIIDRVVVGAAAMTCMVVVVGRGTIMLAEAGLDRGNAGIHTTIGTQRLSMMRVWIFQGPKIGPERGNARMSPPASVFITAKIGGMGIGNGMVMEVLRGDRETAKGVSYSNMRGNPRGKKC